MFSSSSVVDEVVDVADKIVAVSLALSGKFDDRIAEFKKEQAALDAKKLIAKTLDEAVAIKDKAQREYDVITANAAALKLKSEQVSRDLDAKAATLEKAEADLASRERFLAKGQEELQKGTAALRAEADATRNELGTREQQVNSKEKDFQYRQSEFDVRKAKF